MSLTLQRQQWRRITPAPLSGRSGELLAATAAGRPRADALRAQHVLGDANLLRAGGLVRHADAAVGVRPKSRRIPGHRPIDHDGLRAALREDSDIVLVGEMRDLETISLALTAAETGLLVFGTLHTNNARKTVDRIIDVFPSDQQSQVRTMLSASLRGVVAQLLCKRVDKPGRTAVHEIMFATPAVAAIIREGATQKLYDVITGGKGEGMQFMDESIWTKLREGMISPEEAYMKSIDKTRFKRFLPENLSHLGDASGESPMTH